LTIALVTSFFTVCLIEPIKAFILRGMRKREIRRALYQEMVHNYQALLGQVTMANHNPQMKDGIGARFAMGFKKLSLELAQRDPATYYSLGDERYWIELRYSDMEHVITGRFENEDQHLRCADSATYLFLASVKDRNLSRRLVFRMSPNWLRKHLRENLPEVPYTDIEPPGLIERMQRRFDENEKASTKRI
jgi:hypothetical protein